MLDGEEVALGILQAAILNLFQETGLPELSRRGALGESVASP